MNDQSPDRDQRLADQLARLHQQMLEPSSVEGGAEESDEALEGEQEVLGLIERVKRADRAGHVVGDHATQPGGALETYVGDVPEWDAQADQHGMEIPQRIGRFQIVKLLGQGGYGIVYHAIDPELDRHVAIKIPRAETLFTRDLRSRFIREGKIAAALSHPNIVTIYETGQEGSICFMVSELVEGITLADWIADQTEPVDQRSAVKLLCVLADALQHAHRRGVLHRDLKPANILIAHTEPDRISAVDLASSAQIADFGLARYQGDAAGETRSGALIGTPAYMAPEQMNESRNTGPAADIYALGCILFELLAGQRPFVAAGVLEMIQAVQNSEAKPIHTFRSDVSRDLEAICLKCLEKNPAHRYSSAYALKQDLENFLENRPVTARRIGPWGRWSRWARRNPALATATGGLLAALIIGLVTVSILLIRSNDLLQKTEAMRRRSVDSANELQYAVDDLLTVLANMPEIETAGFEPVRAKLLNRVSGYYDRFSEAELDDPQLRKAYSTTLYSMASIRSRLGDVDGAIASGRQLLSLQPDVSQSTASELQLRIDVLLLLAKQLTNRSEPESRDLVNTALDLARDPSSAQQDSVQATIDLAMTLSEVSSYFSNIGDATTSRQYMAEAIKQWEQVSWDQINDEKTALAYGQALLAAAINHSRAEAREDALRCCDLSVAFFEDKAQEADVSDAVLYALARSLRVKSFLYGKDPVTAGEATSRATEILSELSIRHPVVGMYPLSLMEAQYTHGLNLYIAKDYEQSAKVLRDNIEFGDELLIRFPGDEPRILLRYTDNLTMLGIVLGYLKQHDEQLDVYHRAKAILARRYPDESVDNAAIISSAGLDGEIGKCLNLLERYEEAMEYLDNSIERLSELLEGDPENGQARRFLSNSYKWLADALAAQDNYADAISALQQRIANDENNHPHADLGRMARWHLQLGQWEQALQSSNRYHQFCVNEGNVPQSSVGLANDLLEILDNKVGQGLLGPDQSKDILNQVTPQAIEALNAMLTASTKPSETLEEIDGARRYSRLRETNAYRRWRSESANQ